ncbi:type 1 glutamine amidotransferase domain-containing protein [Altererythrobacter sp. H2]|uniref:type 1 glutamine amidotransferase domain-containing protein n=1 Tax=Altererythrobacter sp. H2 TaxID=3108391 RepID=UPI002B4BB1AB|nr:type 1 glutamine amidotransferase domain-containing protein [Altererythrobacter sp. H2]WRK96756.1 type 1 glutamine amidotransferase domain-containing protein [Altererythrobacter sp. H2]
MSRVLIMATNGFEQSELTGPRERLEQAGIETRVASPERGEIRGWQDKDWGEAVTVDLSLDKIDVGDYDALLLPGGQMNPDILRMDDRAIGVVNDFAEADKIIAAICHAPWLLAEAGLLEGRIVTSWPSIRTDLINAGADVVDRDVVEDGNLITSRKPDDVPAFSEALIARLRLEQSEAA